MYSFFAYKGKKQVHLQGCFVQWREGFVQWWLGEGGGEWEICCLILSKCY